MPSKKLPAETMAEYRQRVMEVICDELANSDKSMWTICDEIPDAPIGRTVSAWIADSPELQQKYARAKELQADYMAAQIIMLADECRQGAKTTVKGDGSVEVVTGDMVDRSRLQIDARKWLAAKLAPKKYGDRITQEHTGPGGEPLDLNINFIAAPKRAEIEG